ncbi:GTPase-activating protein and VPS9 domain-containing protein 1-like isoform X2 [Mizuhopecten yessoensis]|uniref:GTPase-activating protein and VPS9 domain-containing protein 1-like isoform X2 n=1 Tax=Mizuhopecten yessoensis TaxID=6573 RepID=UPI000B45C03C|nr:GTPase-activating protein and VPS9 domain-containing protein 1-like isoform X2 [Mizuhopecten yessoensis]
MELLELARHLKQEQLFVTSERFQLQKLFDEVKHVAEGLYHESWVTREQKACLDSLIFSPQNMAPKECCRRANHLQWTNFVDSYKHLSYHDSKYGEFLAFLRENPSLLAHCVETGEKSSNEYTLKVVPLLVSSVCGNCLLLEDEQIALRMMTTLAELQLATNDDPRRLLRKGSCAFSVMYKLVLDSLFSAKLFLTAALHDPVMRLLMEDEWFYDIDPQKALVRFPPQERMKRFGEPGTDDYTKKFQEYRTFIVDKLVVLANRFINSLKNNIHCFPAGMGWLVSQIYHILTKAGKLSGEKVQAICADLVFSLFLCPAICDPDPHGITSDIHISHIARHNLMQIAQIIQVLAVSQWEEGSRVTDLYERFEKGCVSGLLDALIHGIGTELPGTGIGLGHTQNLTRSSVLITLPQLNMVVGFLRSVLPIVDESVAERKQLEDLIQGLPSNLNTSTNSLVSTPSQTPPGTPSSQKKLSKGAKKKLALTPGTGNHDDALSPQPGDTDSSAGKEAEDVLILSLGTDIDCPGMMTENKVLSWEQENKRRKVKYQTPAGLFAGDGPPVEIHEKRTRFSLSQDQESIGNTSDIQEAISEAASSHSVGSVDMENDDDNDNFSDMISANVSGRGTPNISGRDTPLSQAESEQEQEAPAPALPETVQKSNRVDVTDRFGKFELERDETKSTVSDTWSTDVLASDSEPPEQNQFDRLEEIREEMVRQSLLARNDIVSEVSETASDAWSTDVLGSDTEEKQAEILSEFDQDDVGSVTDLASISGEQSLPEIQDTVGNEDTPLASGHQSPTEDHQLDPMGAVGGASSNASYTPSTQPRPRGKKNPFAKSNSTPSDSVFEDNDPGVPVMPMRLSTSSHFDHNKLNVPVKQGRGHQAKLSHSKQSNYLSVPDPKSSSHSSDRACSADSLSFRNPMYNGAKPKEKQRATFAGFGHSQQQQQASLDLTGFAPVKPSQKHKQVLSWAGPVTDQASFATNNQGSPSSNNSQTDLDILSEQMGNVKLSEQQNTTLVDTRRLSAALSMFDPVVAGDSGDLLDDMSHCSASSKEMIGTLSNMNNDDKKMDAEPLIQFTDRSEAASSQVANKDLKIPVPMRVSNTGAHELLSPSAASEGGSPVNGDEAKEDVIEKRRDSVSSSHSSGSGNTSDGAPFTKSSRSASFDNMSQRSEEKENGDDDQDDKSPDKKKGFFKSFKEKINKGKTQCKKCIKRKGNKHESSREDPNDLNSSVVSNGQGDGSKSSLENSFKDESTDDILAKYRKKPQGILSSQSNESGGATGSSVDVVPSTVAFSNNPIKEKRFSIRDEDMTDSPHYDPNNLENCFAFIDAKRKLRIVLSSAEFQVGYTPLDLTFGGVAGLRGDNNRKDNELVRLLRAQLAEAINLQNKDLIAQLHEAIRCVRMFDNDGLKKLVRSLQDEYHSRSAYVSYLIRCRQGLLSTLSHVTRLLNRVSRYKEVCNRHLTSVLVRMFIEKRETSVMKFISDFQKLSVPDEKTDFVEQFLQYLYQNMNQDPIWQASNDNQMEDARVVMERYIMSRIYTHAMFPNGDGDIMRDQILHKHIKMLSQVITPTHKDLGIPRMYHFECPWTAAQREIYMLNAYKTPKDKLQSVQRCAATIMNLLSMANEKSVPAADDFMPVMIYVVIKANPPCMLSTIQFVNSFYGDRLSGEEQYWWMQFSSAVEFIKNMEYSSE